jgi:hypothetical protein
MLGFLSKLTRTENAALEPPKQTQLKDGPQKQDVATSGKLDATFIEDFNRIAQKVGSQKRASASVGRLADLLSELTIQVYDLAKVEEYMDEKGYWGWFPVRAVTIRSFGSGKIGRVTQSRWPTLYGDTENTPYIEAIPYPVLLTIESIIDKAGEDAEFYIAALKKDPDPFLAVRLTSDPTNVYVIERWDEPSFRG